MRGYWEKNKPRVSIITFCRIAPVWYINLLVYGLFPHVPT